MKKLIFTADAFTGHSVLLYNEQDALVAIDCTASDATNTQRDWLFKHAPRHMGYLKQFLASTRTGRIVQEDLAVTFDMFWDKYAKKLNRKRSLALWGKLPKTKQVFAYHGIDKYNYYLSCNQWRSKADPDTYLRNEMWENEWK